VALHVHADVPVDIAGNGDDSTHGNDFGQSLFFQPHERVHALTFLHARVLLDELLLHLWLRPWPSGHNSAPEGPAMWVARPEHTGALLAWFAVPCPALVGRAPLINPLFLYIVVGELP